MKPAAQIDLYFPALAPGRILGRALGVYRQRGFRLLQDYGLGTAVLGLVLFALGPDIRGAALALPAIAVYLATTVTLTGRCMMIRLVGDHDMALDHRVVLPAGALGLVQAATVAACLGLAIAAESTVEAQFGPLANSAGSVWGLLARALAIGASALLLCRWQVAVPAMVAERVGPLAALRRSWQLTRGWTGRGLIVWLSAGIPSLAALAVLLLRSPTAELLWRAVATAVLLGWLPFTVITAAVAYRALTDREQSEASALPPHRSTGTT